MKNKLFGRNIAPDCSYCENSYFENGIIGCKKSKRILLMRHRLKKLYLKLIWMLWEIKSTMEVQE